MNIRDASEAKRDAMAAEDGTGEIIAGRGAGGHWRYWVVGCRHNLQRAIGHSRERAELCAAGVRAGTPEVVLEPREERGDEA